MSSLDLYYIILLGFAVSMDGFFAGMAYGIKKIHIPLLSLLTIGALTLFYTAIAAYSSHFLLSVINPKITTIFGSLLLISIGTVNIIKQVATPYHRTEPEPTPTKNFNSSTDNIFLYIIEKPERADIDRSNHLSIVEALLLGTALGVDNMVATFAAGLADTLPLYTPFVMCIIQTTLLYSGIVISKKIISKKLKERLTYLPGIVLILIGLFRLF